MSEPARQQPATPDAMGAEMAQAVGAVLDAAAPPVAGSTAAGPNQRGGSGHVRGFP